MGNAIELQMGQVFGCLTVIKRSGKNARGLLTWACLCQCGKEKDVTAVHLRNGIIVSCGCYGAAQRLKSKVTHGLTKSGTYSSWTAMHQRCKNPASKPYKKYGAAGITVCDRWVKFENFLADMGERPPGHSIDRFPDRNGNYEPTNCRWATIIQQARNKDRTLLTFEDAERIRELRRSTGMSAGKIASTLGLPKACVHGVVHCGNFSSPT